MMQFHLNLTLFLSIILICRTINAFKFEKKNDCGSCGDECSAACGTAHFRTCCFSYLKKRNTDQTPSMQADTSNFAFLQSPPNPPPLLLSSSSSQSQQPSSNGNDLSSFIPWPTKSEVERFLKTIMATENKKYFQSYLQKYLIPTLSEREQQQIRIIYNI